MNTACVAFAFGVPASTKANQRIAEMACTITTPSYPGIYTQRDIQINRALRPRMFITYTAERPGYPPPTLRIARNAVNWGIDNNITTLVIACAYPHLWRCRRDLQIAIKEKKAKIKVIECPEARQKKGWFCPESTQDRTRTRLNWYLREIILMIMPVWLYKKVAH